MAFNDFLYGTPARNEQIPRFGQQQQGGLNQLISMLQGQAQNPTTGFQPIEQQARSQFHSQTVPSIAERFSAMGSGGSQRSSAFQGSLGNAGAGLEQGLAALKSQYGMQQQGQAQNLLSGLLTTPQFDTVHFGNEPGFLENFFGPLLGGIGQGAAQSGIPLLFGQQEQGPQLSQFGQNQGNGANMQKVMQILGFLAKSGAL